MFRPPLLGFLSGLSCVCLVLGCATGAQAPTSGDGASDLGGGGSSPEGGGSSVGGSHAGSGTADTGGATGPGGTTGSAGSASARGGAGGGTSLGGTSSGSGGAHSGGTTGTNTGGSSSSGGGMSPGGTSSGGTSTSAGGTSAGGTSAGGTTGSTGGASGTVLFSDDFESGSTKWTTAGGTWAIATDTTNVFAQTSETNNSTLEVATAGSSWTDQIVEAKVKVVKFVGSSASYYAGIYARNNGTDYYSLVIRSSDSRVAIRKDKTTLGTPADVGIVVGTWYTLRLEVVGSMLKGYVNGTLAVTLTDSSVTSGGIGLTTVSTTAEFDDVKVSLP